MRDLLVVGLDLETGKEVHIGDRPVREWRAKGHNGDKSLVCMHCLRGADGPGARQVPLVPKYKLHGKRRAHFAHPPGQAPINGTHSPETLWHSYTKAMLRDWASRQPQVVSSTVEHWTCGGRRRSDVSVTLENGCVVALEVQQQPMTDSEWIDRHLDYQRAGVIDVWLWHPQTGVPAILYEYGQSGWLIDPDGPQVGTVYSAGQLPAGPWWDAVDTGHFTDRWPPSLAGKKSVAWHPLDEMTLGWTGLRPPAAFTNQLAEKARRTERQARRARTDSRRPDTKTEESRDSSRPEEAAPLEPKVPRYVPREQSVGPNCISGLYLLRRMRLRHGYVHRAQRFSNGYMCSICGTIPKDSDGGAPEGHDVVEPSEGDPLQ